MIVPGSILLGHNHLYGWYVYVQDKAGVKTTYWHNGGSSTPEEVAAIINKQYPNVTINKIEPCTKPPDRTLKPVPPHHFQYGLLHPDEPDPEDKKPPLPLWKPGMALPKFTPLRPRKSLWPAHH